MIHVPNQVVDCFDVVALFREEGTFLQGKSLTCSLQNEFYNDWIRDICRRGQLTERQTRNTIYQHVALIAPIEFIFLFVLLVGSCMDAE